MEISRADRETYALRAVDAATLRAILARSSTWYAKFLEKWLPSAKDARILDLPCGAGNLLYALRALGFTNASGVDVDPGQVEVAKQLGLPAEVGNVFDALAREADGRVARIFSLDFLEHVSQEQAIEFCKLAKRALLPGGMLICRTPCADGPFGSHDRHNDLTHRWGMTSGAAYQFLQLAGFPPAQVAVVAEAPVPYKFVNRLRLMLYKMTTSMMGVFLELCGIGAPRIWTRSMWLVAERPSEPAPGPQAS